MSHPNFDGHVYPILNRRHFTRDQPQRSVPCDTIIIHAMAEYIDDAHDDHAIDFLARVGLSAHYLICPSGVILNMTSPTQVAYHAKGWNDRSIGIEILVPGLHTYTTFTSTIENKMWWWKQDQWQAAAELTTWLLKDVVPPANVLRHSDVDPGRKIDPGAKWPWEAFLNTIGANKKSD